MEQNLTILEGHSDLEKGAYLGAIASMATADRSASQEELAYIDALIEAAGLSDEQSDLIRKAATSEMSDNDLKRCLDTLKTSELRFSLVSDVLAFAEADQTYSDVEKQNVEKIASYLNVNQEQFSLLDQFTKKAIQEAPTHADALQSEQTTPGNFLDSLGFGDKLKNAGINTNSLIKGALGIIGPIILAKMLSGGRGGGLLGNLLNGGRGLSGGRGGGLLGSLLNGGRGLSGARNMLGRIFGGNL